MGKGQKHGPKEPELNVTSGAADKNTDAPGKDAKAGSQGRKDANPGNTGTDRLDHIQKKTPETDSMPSGNHGTPSPDPGHADTGMSERQNHADTGMSERQKEAEARVAQALEEQRRQRELEEKARRADEAASRMYGDKAKARVDEAARAEAARQREILEHAAGSTGKSQPSMKEIMDAYENYHEKSVAKGTLKETGPSVTESASGSHRYSIPEAPGMESMKYGYSSIPYGSVQSEFGYRSGADISPSQPSGSPAAPAGNPLQEPEKGNSVPFSGHTGRAEAATDSRYPDTAGGTSPGFPKPESPDAGTAYRMEDHGGKAGYVRPATAMEQARGEQEARSAMSSMRAERGSMIGAPAPEAPAAGSSGVVSDAAGRYYDSATREVLFRSEDGKFYNAADAVEKGIVTQGQADAESRRAYGSAQYSAGFEAPPMEPGSGPSGVSAPETAMPHGSALQERGGRASFDAHTPSVPGGETSYSYPGGQVVTDGRGRYYDSATHERVYQGGNGSFHSAEEAVSMGIVSREQVEADRSVNFNANRRSGQDGAFSGSPAPSVPHDPATESGSSLRDISLAPEGIRQEYDARMQDRSGRTEYESHTPLGTPQAGASSGSTPVTDGRGNYYDPVTRERVYKGNDGSFHKAEEAVSMGIVSRQQADADRTQQRLGSAPYNGPAGIGGEGVSGLIKDDPSSGYRAGEQKVPFATGTPEKNFAHISGDIYTDGNGQYFNNRTHERMYRSGDGNFHTASQAVSAGLISKEQAETDRKASVFAAYTAKSAEVPSGAGNVDSALASRLAQDAGAGQRMFYDGSASQGSAAPQGAGTRLTRVEGETGIYTDGRGQFYNGETRERMYRSDDGKFHTPEQAVSAGILSKEQAEADRRSNVLTGNQTTRPGSDMRGVSSLIREDGAATAGAAGSQKVPFAGMQGAAGERTSFTHIQGDVYTDSHGQYFNARTNERMYRSDDGKFHTPEQAVAAGMITREQADADRKAGVFAAYTAKSAAMPSGAGNVDPALASRLAQDAGAGQRMSVNSGQAQGIQGTQPPLTRIADGISTDGNGRFYREGTGERVYRSGDGKFHTADQAVAAGILSREQADADKATSPFAAQAAGTPGTAGTQQAAAGRMFFNSAQAKESGTAGIRLARVEGNDNVYTDGRGQFFSGETRERLYRSEDGKFHTADQAVTAGILSREKADADKAANPFAAQATGAADFRMAASEAGRQGFTHVQGDIYRDQNGRYFNGRTSERMYRSDDGKFHTPEQAVAAGIISRAQADADRKASVAAAYTTGRTMEGRPGLNEAAGTQQAAGRMFFNSAQTGSTGTQPPLTRVADGISTDGNGRFYREGTRERMYRSDDGKFHTADQAVAAGILSREQADTDRRMNTYAAAAAMGAGAAAAVYSGTGHNAAPIPPGTVRMAKNVYADSQGRYFNSITRERVYRSGDGAFHDAQQAVAMGILTKEQADMDRAASPLALSGAQAAFAAGTRGSAGEAAFTKAADGIYADKEGRFFHGETQERMYRSGDGKFHTADQAVAAGVITKEKAAADRAANPYTAQTAGMTAGERRMFFESRAAGGAQQAAAMAARDPLLGKAAELAAGKQTVTAASIQKELGVDAARASRLMDQMEASGVITRQAGKEGAGAVFSVDAAKAGQAAVLTASAGGTQASPLIVADGQGRHYNTLTKEPVYPGKDGKFVSADQAVKNGLITREAAAQDRSMAPEAIRKLTMAQQAKGSGAVHLQAAGNGNILTDGERFYDRSGKRLYMVKDGSYVTAGEAVKRGVLTEKQASADLDADRKKEFLFNNAPLKGSAVTGDPVADKTRFVSLREQAGFGRSVSGFTPDAAHAEMLKIAAKEGHVLSGTDDTFAMSRIFKARLAEGLNSEQAYEQAREVFAKMKAEGHSAESVAATFTKGIKKEDIEFLKKNGTALDPKQQAFSAGQRAGRAAATGKAANPAAAKVARRIAGQDGKTKASAAAAAAGAAAKGSVKEEDNPGVVKHKLYYPTGRVAAIANASRSVTMGVSMMGMTLFYSAAGQSASGLRQTQDYLTMANLTVGMTIANRARKIVNRPLSMELQGLLKAKCALDLVTYRKSLNAQFTKLGLKPLSSGLTGAALTRAAQVQILAIKLQIAKQGATPALMQALKVAQEYKKLGTLTTFAKAPHKMRLTRRLTRLGAIGFRKMLMTDPEAFKGVDMVSRYTKNALNAGKAFLWAGQRTTRLGVRLGGSAVNLTGKAAAKAGGALAKSGNTAAVKAGTALQKYGRGVKKAGAAKRRVGKKVSHVREKAGRFIKDPFGIRAKTKRQIYNLMMKAYAKLAARFKFIGRMGKAAKALSHVAAVFSTVAGAVSQVIFFGLGLFFLFVLALLFLNIVVTMIVGAFDFSGYEDSVQDIIVNKLEECYEEDIQKMLDIAGDYNTSTIDYDDSFRDFDKYTQYKEEAEAESFLQSTNCAEIIAMTCVRFEYDVDSIADTDVTNAEKRAIESYIEELYYGSHEIYVNTTTSTTETDSGATRTYTTATITYRTYYFEYMFDETYVPTGRSETPVIYSGSGSGSYGSVTDEASIYVFLRNAGLSHAGACGVMGNIQQESNFSPTAGTTYYGLCQWSSSIVAEMREWCIANGYDYTTSTGQMNFLIYDLTNNSTAGSGMNYSKLYTLLCSDTWADDAKANASFFCMAYERCVGGSDEYEYWDVYTIYSSGTTYKYQELEERIAYAQAFASTYAAYADDWSDLVSTGDSLVSYAVQYEGRIHYTQGTGDYVGTRYLGSDLDQAVYSGSGTPTIGTDCSGFVYSVYAHYGITVPTYTGGYSSTGKISLSEIQPGDILWRDGHCAIYIGNNQIIQASTCYGGTHSGDLNIATYNESSWTCAYHFW